MPVVNRESAITAAFIAGNFSFHDECSGSAAARECKEEAASAVLAA
jgi:hypothetical protein